MSDEAFARRFYSDRAELLALGVPLQSQRDEFTGEELYTLRSEQYFLPQLELDDDELAALQTALYLLEGKFAYAEPLRLALQNLALGRPGFDERADRDRASASRSSTPTTRPRCRAGSGSSRARSRSSARSSSRTGRSRATSTPSARSTRTGCYRDARGWYVVGHDLDRKDMRTFRVSRIRGDIRFATRRERDFRIPTDFDVDDYRGRPAWQIGGRARRGADRGGARHRLVGASASSATAAGSRTASSSRSTRHRRCSPRGSSARTAARCRSSPTRLGATSLGASRVRDRPRGRAAGARSRRATGASAVIERDRPPARSRRSASPCSRRCSRTCSPRCGEAASAEIPARELVERFHIPEDQLEEHLSLLNLVNFGGGCYTVYAELQGDVVRVDKELYGDTFRAPPRLTPLEARAIRLALEFVGPMIAARRAHAARPRPPEARGDVRPVRARADARAARPTATRRSSSRRSRAAIRDRQLVEIEYQKEGEETCSRRARRAVRARARAAVLVRAHVGPHVARRRAELPARPHAQRAALRRALRAARRLRPARRLRDARTARVLYSPAIARWRDRARRACRSRTAARSARFRVGSDEWLVGEILAHRGEAVVLEPEDLRPVIAARAKELAQRARRRAPARHGLAATEARAGRSRPRSASSDVERAAVRLGDRARDEEAETGAGHFARASRGRTSRRSACWSSRGIPGPWSTTSTSDLARSPPSPHVDLAARGEYLTALSTRFATTCRSRSRSPRMAGDRVDHGRERPPRPGRSRPRAVTSRTSSPRSTSPNV